MKKIVKSLAAALMLSAMLCSCYIQKETAISRTITVSGTGSASVAPDIAYIEFNIVTAGWSAKQIVTDNDTLTNRLTEAIKNVGVNEDDITQTSCTVTNPSSQYESRRSVRVTVRNISLVPAVVDCKYGSFVRLGKVEFASADPASQTRRARTAAIQNAQDSASLLSGASGCKIGDVVEIKDETTETATADGKIVTTARVTVTYTLM